MLSELLCRCVYLCEFYLTVAQNKVGYKSDEYNTAVQRQKAVSAYFTSKQIQPFAFAEQNSTVVISIMLHIIILWFLFIII